MKPEDPSLDEATRKLEEEYHLDLDKLPKPEHKWVERGIVVSCEGASHPNHRHFLVKPPK